MIKTEKKRKVLIDILLDSPWYLTLSLKERKELIERVDSYLHTQHNSAYSGEQEEFRS